MKVNYKECPYCGRQLNLSNYQRHVNKHIENPDYVRYHDLKRYKVDHNDLFCKFCGKECKNLNSLTQHEIRCKENPNHININSSNGIYKCNQLGLNVWNRGLTKDSDERLRKMSENKKGICTNPYKGRASTPEKEELRKQNISKSFNSEGKAGRGRKGRYKGIYCSSSFELAFVIYCLDHNINLTRFSGSYVYEYGGVQHRYYPDFIIDNTIYEIKGFWTDVVQAKIDAVKDRPIVVLYRKDLDFAFDYIFLKYGKKDLEIVDLYEETY